jgi:hypothetical protein
VNATGSRLDTDGLQIAAIPGFGLFQSGARSQHLGARIVGNQLRGVVVQESLATSPDDPELLFDQAVLVGNGGAGVQVVDGGGIVFQNGIVAESRSLPNLSGGLGSAAGAMCDGIQLNSSTESSVGTQLRADRSVIFGNGQAGINAQGAGTSLLADGSSAIAVCGTTELDSDRWSCSETEEGELDCLRLEGPAVTGGWSCTDSGGATVCRSGDPLAVDAIAPSFPVRNAADGVTPHPLGRTKAPHPPPSRSGTRRMGCLRSAERMRSRSSGRTGWSSPQDLSKPGLRRGSTRRRAEATEPAMAGPVRLWKRSGSAPQRSWIGSLSTTSTTLR